jgi:hypothetical protein
MLVFIHHHFGFCSPCSRVLTTIFSFWSGEVCAGVSPTRFRSPLKSIGLAATDFVNFCAGISLSRESSISFFFLRPPVLVSATARGSRNSIPPVSVLPACQSAPQFAVLIFFCRRVFPLKSALSLHRGVPRSVPPFWSDLSAPPAHRCPIRFWFWPSVLPPPDPSPVETCL